MKFMRLLRVLGCSFPSNARKKPIPDKVTYSGVSFSDDRGQAEAFNDFFKSIYKDHSKCVIDLNAPILPGVTEQLSHVTVSVDEVVDILRSLDTKKAIGHDKLPTIVLKECTDSLAPSITAIINFNLNKGFQLSDWEKQMFLLFLKKEKESWSKIIAPCRYFQ